MDEEFKTPVELKPSSGLEKKPEMDTELIKTPVGLTSSFSRQSSKPGTSPSKLFPGHSSPAPPDPHLSNWSLFRSWELLRFLPFPWIFLPYPTSYIVATPSNDIAVLASNTTVIIYDINGAYKGIIRIQNEILHFAFVSYTGADVISATQDRLVVIQENDPYVKMYTMEGKVDFQFLMKQHDGKREEAAGLVIAYPCSIAVKKDGTIVVGDLARYVLTEHRPKDGKILRTMQVKIKSEYLAVDDDDRIFVSDRHTVLVVDESSADSITFQPTLDGRRAEVFGLCCNKKDIFVGLSADQCTTGRIHRFDHRGKFVECIGRHLYQPRGLTITGQRHLAVAAYNTVTIYKEESKTQEKDRLGHRDIKFPIRRDATEQSAHYEEQYNIHDLYALQLSERTVPRVTTTWTSQTIPKTSETDVDEEFNPSSFQMESKLGTDVFEEQSLGESYIFEDVCESFVPHGSSPTWTTGWTSQTKSKTSETDVDEECNPSSDQKESKLGTDVFEEQSLETTVSSVWSGRSPSHLELSKWIHCGILSSRELLEPICVAATPLNEIVVAGKHGKVKTYDTNGDLRRSIQINEAAHAISATQHRLVVIDTSSNYVLMYKMDGTLHFKFSTEQHDEGKKASRLVTALPCSVAVQKNGTIVVGDVARNVLTVHRAKNGKILHVTGCKIKPEFLAVGNGDRFLVSDRYNVSVVEGSGKTFTPPTMDVRPATSLGLCYTKSAIFVLVSDDGGKTGRIHQYDNRLNFIQCIVRDLKCPKAITVTPNQRYLAVVADNRVEMYTEMDKAKFQARGKDTFGDKRTSVPIRRALSEQQAGGAKPTVKRATRSYPSQGIGNLSTGKKTLQTARTDTHIEGTPSKYHTAATVEDIRQEETTQDTEVQRLQEPSHLQLVLNKINKLTENLTASERLERRLQLPYIAMGYFNEKGGSLSLHEYGVHLTIPRGAIAPGSPQQVYIYVDPTAPPNNAVELMEVSLSQNVRCGPEGLRFKESVVLSFPHHAVLVSHKYDKLFVRMRHDDSEEKQWEDGNSALVTEKKVFVLVDHFTNFSLVGAPTPGSSKRLKVGAFGGLLDTQCRQYAFRVHAWSDEKNVEEYVLKKEENMKSVMLDDFRNVEFFWNSGNLAVTVSDLVDGWVIRGANEQVIDKETIRVSPENSVTFVLKRQAGDAEDEELYCVARTYQCSLTEDLSNQTEVRLSICPKHEILTMCGQCKGSISKKSTKERHQQEPRLKCTDGNIRCTCQQRAGAAALCAYCEERIGKEILSMVHGKVDSKDFGGLSEKAVWSLCNHLDCERDGANSWKQLVERISDLRGRSISVAVESGKVRTKDLLKLYFDVRRDNNTPDNEAIQLLVGLLIEMKLDRAAEIIQDDLNNKDRDE